ncbi:3-oxoacyl-ACP reductase FabG [Paractinoplanes ferrugineus]|uniref:Beta-ketoacyl-ACP reductase n=1 Tax=Paractinoplanes ferrugineus TaxID=113564 RepID=A0A919J5H1_9ACTN|nr:SDR family NAD(P)-dependent oxidoreductase [Actinoplanes ferrugineus]GIE13707.1 beta-ketoacyl-ACP reductase [Actinoplanes ferrugineus]
MELGLKDRVVLITGGSGGIGRPLAQQFGAEGAHVALTYHRRAETARGVVRDIEMAGGSAMAVPYDLTDRASMDQAVAAVTDRWGDIDALVVNASATGGPNPRPEPFDQISPSTWEPQLRTEVEGAFHTVQAVLPTMRRRSWGRIVFMSASIVFRGRAGDEAYTAGKAALHGLSRSLATELFDDGILSNVVAPGPTLTEGLLGKLPPALRDKIAGRSPEQARKLLDQGMPHLRFSTVEDVTNVVVFLASAANGNVTGSVVNVAGGH